MGRAEHGVRKGSEPIPAIVEEGPEPVGEDVERQLECKYQGEEEVEDV